MAKVLKLVKNKKLKIAYPKAASDFDRLRKLGLSVKFCKLDFLPLLRVAAIAKGVEVELEDFDALEAKAISSLKRKWPGDVDFSKKGLVLSCVRDSEHFTLMKSVRQSMQRFYQDHGMRVDYSIKRRSKSVSVTFTRSPLASVFVLEDER